MTKKSKPTFSLRNEVFGNRYYLVMGGSYVGVEGNYGCSKWLLSKQDLIELRDLLKERFPTEQYGYVPSPKPSDIWRA